MSGSGRMRRTAAFACGLAACGAAAWGAAGAGNAGDYFKITVIDEQTGRGVPLVELRTVNGIRHVTDSNGIVAFHEPGLMNQTVFFFVSSHGYVFPKDGFGFAGKALDVRPGGGAELRLRRLNVAKRLYRVTGGGIYRDSVLLGIDPPIDQPVLNGQVFGQDSVLTAVFGGRIHWFWGDTSRPSYPLGNFHGSGAVSRLPCDGGLDPGVGVRLTYFVDEKGFSRPMAPVPGEGPTWFDGLVVLRDSTGRERMFAAYAKVRQNMEAHQRGLLEYDPKEDVFRPVAQFDLNAPILPGGHPFLHESRGVQYVYFARPYPLSRVRAEAAALADLAQYEAFTCLKPGSRLDQPVVERDAAGKPVFAWKRNAPAIYAQDQARLLSDGTLRRSDALLGLEDIDSGKAILAHGGSVYWNPYRQRWVMIAVEVGGTSFLGEVWYAEADTPVGPWRYAAKIVTHDRYSFYNPKHQPMFDQQGGRIIYFEGTYANTFSGNPDQTPRYDYNQIMYRLDLGDPRLMLPVAVYDASNGSDATRLATAGPAIGRDHGQLPRAAFFAPDRPRPGTVPVFARDDAHGGHVLTMEASATGASDAAGQSHPPKVLFYVLPPTIMPSPVSTVPLYEFVHADGRRRYAIDAHSVPSGFVRHEKPIGYVWRAAMP